LINPMREWFCPKCNITYSLIGQSECPLCLAKQHLAKEINENEVLKNKLKNVVGAK